MHKIKLLLHHCGIARDVPPVLQALTTISLPKKDRPKSSGPHVAVEVEEHHYPSERQEHEEIHRLA